MPRAWLLLAALALVGGAFGLEKTNQELEEVDRLVQRANEEMEAEQMDKMRSGYQSRVIRRKTTEEAEKMYRSSKLVLRASRLIQAAGLAGGDTAEARRLARYSLHGRHDRHDRHGGGGDGGRYGGDGDGGRHGGGGDGCRDGRAPGGQGTLSPRPDLSGLSCDDAPVTCDPAKKYRTLDGLCNNLQHPRWGSASIAFRRALPPAYAGTDSEGVSRPRGRKASARNHCNTGRGSGGVHSRCNTDPKALLPNPRTVSHQFHTHSTANDPQVTHMLTQFGQFLDHDITLTPEVETEDCCEHPDGEECFPINIPCKETASDFANGCLDFVRSTPFCEDAHQVPREQFNGITAFVDASNVYGSSKALSKLLRSNVNGKLHLDDVLLPVINGTRLAGDVRAQEMPGLASMHTVWAREHNRVADRLKKKKPGWGDRKLFQQARRIVIAEMQNVVYNQYMTAVHGQNTVNQLKLVPTSSQTNYDRNMDPSITNNFATAAYRFGHSMIQGLIQMFSLSTRSAKSSYFLRDNYFNLSNYELSSATHGSGMEQILYGLINQPAQPNDQFVSEDISDFLFANIGSQGSDLISRNIQRGRDHGLPGYNDYRQKCGMQRACSWGQAPPEIDTSIWRQLQDIYDSPGDIDLFAGGLAERSHDGGVVGRTFNCLISRQFKSLKFGDRFFFTHQGPDLPLAFTLGQIKELKQRHLGDILCDNTDIPVVKENVFLVNSPDLVCGNHFKLTFNKFA